MRWRTGSLMLVMTAAVAAHAVPVAAASRCPAVLEALPALGGDEGEMMDFRPAGVAVGGALDAQGRFTAVLWRDGRIEDLGAPRGDSQAMNVNGVGVVVGAYDHCDDPS